MGMDIKRLTADFIHMLKDSLILDYSENSTLVSDMNKDMIRKYFKSAPIHFRIQCMEELMDTYNKYTYASNALDYLEASLLKISSYSYEPKVINSNLNMIIIRILKKKIIMKRHMMIVLITQILLRKAAK